MNSDFKSGLYVLATVAGTEVKFLLDTGATCSLLSDIMYRKIARDVRPYLTKTSHRVLTTNNEEVKCLGRITTSLYVADLTMNVNFLVTQIADEGILGLSDLIRFGGKIDLDKGELWLNDQLIPLHSHTAMVHSRRVFLNKATVLPPYSETTLIGQVDETQAQLPYPEINPDDTGELNPDDVNGLRSETTKAEEAPLRPQPCKEPYLLTSPRRLLANHGVLTARTLVNEDENTVPLRMLNSNPVAITLQAGQTVAIASPIGTENVRALQIGEKVASGEPTLTEGKMSRSTYNHC